MKFKVGDFVKGSPRAPAHSKMVGMIMGQIVDIRSKDDDDCPYGVKILFHRRSHDRDIQKFISEGSTYYALEQSIELVRNVVNTTRLASLFE